MKAPGASVPNNRDITDILLWLGAAAVTGIALSWLFLAQPWNGMEDSVRRTGSESLTTTNRLPTGPTADRLEVPIRSADETLRMARLAYDSGMLVEPERYSAWSLYTQLIDADPTDAEALEGRQRVADLLVERAAVALEQGRTDAAQRSLEWVLGTLPDHAAALRLAARSHELVERAAERVMLAPSIREAVAESSRPEPLVPVERAAPAPVNPLDELHKSFDTALAAGNLLQPADASANYFLNQMLALDRDNAQALAARAALFATLLERATAAIAGFDSAAAAAWIDAAETIGNDPDRILQIREQLIDRRIEAEAQTPLPAAELAIATYVPPRYPRAAANLEIQGWVDVEFVVGLDGRTANVAVTAASHDELFRNEAVAAVEQWRFEPRVILGRPIAQTAYTRIRFALE